ncbi:MAG TPA: glycerol-3-phosphate 1-O-acyltransferase PlsY [Tepidisphaeraceae bacterium]|jgi:glycerol-3-phosphate acyltransferase PlsY|nr:glycerol-3-phosphate 1-O-acyltransferase PlsY [Tepidisphaeraceae bacterium]
MTSAQLGLIALVPAAYIAGSIPFGLIVGLSKGIDPRKAGSGNIGATNVGRLLGGKFFAIVFVLDLLKGLLPTLAAGAILHFKSASAAENALWLTAGFAAIFGHMFSIFIGFKGGKGVATSTGVILGVFPYYTLGAVAALAVWGIVFMLTRYVSLASMAGAVAFTITYVILGLVIPTWDIFGKQWPLLGFAILVTVMIIVKHRGNLARLRAGTENRIGKKGSGANEVNQ